MESCNGEAQGLAVHLADAVRSELSHRAARQRLHGIEVRSVRAVSSSTVEVVWSCADENALRGLRLQRSDVRSSSTRIQQSDPKELAFDLVLVGVQEPRAREEFTAPDGDGIRWLPTDAWLDP